MDWPYSRNCRTRATEPSLNSVWAQAGTYVRGYCLEAHFWLNWRMFGILSPSLCVSFWIDRKG